MSAESAFFESLTTEKRAGLAEASEAFVRSHAKEMGAALLGGGIASAAQYFMNRPGPGGSSSLEQQSTQDLVDRTQASMNRAHQEGRHPSFGTDLAHSTSQGMAGLANTFARHPARSAFIAAAPGATLGLALLKALSSIK